MKNAKNQKAVYTVIDRNGRPHLLKLGVGHVNEDGSIDLELDAIPTNGKLHVRDVAPSEHRPTDVGPCAVWSIDGGRARPLLTEVLG